MNRVTLLLAWRYLFGTRYEKNISIMAKICFASTFIGSFALALILCIMNGFEKVTHAQLQGIHANIIVRAYGDTINTAAVGTILDKEFPEIAAWSPTASQQALITSSDTADVDNVIMIKGIDPVHEAGTSTLEHKIIKSTGTDKKLSKLVHDNSVIIGKGLAQELRAIPGTPITILFTTTDSPTRKITFAQQEAVVSGIFATGIDEFDNGLLFCSLDFLQQLWPHIGPEQINIRLAPSASEPDVIAKLNKRLGLEIYSWKDLYPALVSALKLEKYAMFFILSLITLVASMNIISLTFMHITQKKADRALLQSMGMRITDIRNIFLLVSSSVAFLGALCGLTCAAGAGYILAHYPFITLPDSYYTSQLPIVMEWHLFCIVFFLVMLLSLLAAFIPSRRITDSSLSELLRQ